ncbi:hypothetical protein G3N18_11825 [Microbacterium sp. 2C]|uniref:hypothetical protein n=1 Tax=Microbacterium paulum TaxID=2707006 RepID=UPI0018C2CD19|nr:hypothetical protein [Microbacterium paulum]MBG0718741.1 hypothetical protein [Microbacterium paulum]
MFITLTARNDGKREIINADRIKHAWIDPNPGDDDHYTAVHSELMLRIVFVGDSTTYRYVPVDEHGEPQSGETDPAKATRAFERYLSAAAQ